jgi:hypothetical protein
MYGGVGFLVCFWAMGSSDVDSMEGIVADQARYMLRTGDHTVPHLYGVPYTYKPPLAAWLVAGSFKLAGAENEWSLRLPNALCGLAMGLAVLLIVGRAIDPKTGCWCALAVITSALVVQKMRLAEFDMPLAAGVGIAVAVACCNLSAPRPSRALWLVGYAALAAGILAKGVPAVMLHFPGLLAAAIVTRQWRRLFTFSHLAGVLACALLVGLWIWRAYEAMGPALFDHPLMEAYGSGLGWSPKRLLRTLLKPLIIAAVFLPWSVLIPLTWRRGWWQGLDQTTRRMEAASGAFLAIGILVCMAVPVTNVRYYLPLAVPMAIVCGLAARAPITRRDDADPHAGPGAPDSVKPAVTGSGAADPASGTRPSALCDAGIPACSATDVGAVVSDAVSPADFSAYERRLLPWVLRGLLLGGLCHWAIFVFVIKPHRAHEGSLRPAAEAFAEHIPANSPVAADVGDSYSSLFFYMDRPVRAVSVSTGHLEPGTFIILDDEHLPALTARPDCPHTILERTPADSNEILLAQILPPE